MKTKVVKIPKTMIAATLFLLLTAVKLLMPMKAEALCSGVREIVNRDYDYMQAFETLGEKLSDGAFIEALWQRGEDVEEHQAYPRPVVTYHPVTVSDIRGELTEILPMGTVHAVCTEESGSETEDAVETTGTEAAPEVEAEVPEVPDAVAAFMEVQAEFADYEVPVNVSYEMPVLPFEHASPVPGYTSSGFGFRWHPIYEDVRFHYGTDFAAWSGDDIYAFAGGTVSMVGFEEGYGNYIVIDHGDGWETQYAHCSTVYVTGGQSVEMGDKIALVGATGEVTGPHLHFELRCDGIYYNPEYYMT